MHGLAAATGIVTARGGPASHAAVVARAMGKPAVVGVTGLTVDTERAP
ncbi:PEP-utilizing enzyme [Streptomyces sp. M10(2022)]